MFPNVIPTLRPGDVLFYEPTGWLGRLISLKTWSPYSHTELWVGPAGRVWAARHGNGVDFFRMRRENLLLIRRPVAPVNDRLLLEFCNQTIGQQYDLKGLLRFFNIQQPPSLDRMFCSEAVTRALRIATSRELFADIDADLVSPSMLAWTPALRTIWKKS
jgi:hypothetical protein